METITLPGKEEMLKSLIEVDDSNDLREKFYPLFLDFENKKMNKRGVIGMITLAINSYTKDMSEPQARSIQEELKSKPKMDKFIEALAPGRGWTV